MSKRTNQTAARVMKLAHSIKAQFATFSAALRAAWAQIKQPVLNNVELAKKLWIEIQAKQNWANNAQLKKDYMEIVHPILMRLNESDRALVKNAVRLVMIENRF